MSFIVKIKDESTGNFAAKRVTAPVEVQDLFTLLVDEQLTHPGYKLGSVAGVGIDPELIQPSCRKFIGVEFGNE